ncbi:MAG: hypothetical protein R2688_08975 [Fimbriimonadaceae bacterium]
MVEARRGAAKERLLAFLDHVDSYGEERDFPALESTSGLSVHLRHGTISIRECFREAMKLNSAGAKKWVSELIWREFYHMISRTSHKSGKGTHSNHITMILCGPVLIIISPNGAKV